MSDTLLARPSTTSVLPSFRRLTPTFVAEVGALDLRDVHDKATLDHLQQGMADHGILVFRDQHFTHDEQLAFAERFDGTLHAKTSVAVLGKNRFGNEALTDISNVGADGQILAADDRLRVSTISNRLWHTDASFENPPGRFSMLFARVVPPVSADTEFADMRAAYEALPDDEKRSLDGLEVHHSIAHSREIMGFVFSAEERERLKGTVQPLVRVSPRNGRKSLYLASHASHIIGMPIPEGRLVLRDLIEFATQPQFVYRHAWRPDDFVIWDNRSTMHRARRFDDKSYRRELTRTTTLDLPS